MPVLGTAAGAPPVAPRPAAQLPLYIAAVLVVGLLAGSDMTHFLSGGGDAAAGDARSGATTQGAAVDSLSAGGKVHVSFCTS